MNKDPLISSNYTDVNENKVLLSLIAHVYMQTNVAMFASVFCATIIFIALFNSQTNNVKLLIWATFFLTVSALRIILSNGYSNDKFPQRKINFWRNLYIIGSLLGGISWGALGVYFFPEANAEQQILMILMLAGVTAGAVPFSAAVPSAAIVFLVSSLPPFIISIALLQNYTYLLFDMAVSLYLVYMIILTIRSYHLINNSVILKFENDALLSNLEISNKKLEYAATHDPLTQVANRRLFKFNFDTAIKHAQENKKLLALFYIDLDNFKFANDIYGHRTGDLVLITVIERLKESFYKEDIIARLGGDELAMIIENMTNRDEIETIARKICQLIAIPIVINDVHIKISASIGIGIYPFDGKDYDTLLRYSDKYMYYVKEHGGNNYYLNKESEELVE